MTTESNETRKKFTVNDISLETYQAFLSAVMAQEKEQRAAEIRWLNATSLLFLGSSIFLLSAIFVLLAFVLLGIVVISAAFPPVLISVALGFCAVAGVCILWGISKYFMEKALIQEPVNNFLKKNADQQIDQKDAVSQLMDLWEQNHKEQETTQSDKVSSYHQVSQMPVGIVKPDQNSSPLAPPVQVERGDGDRQPGSGWLGWLNMKKPTPTNGQGGTSCVYSMESYPDDHATDDGVKSTSSFS